MRGKPARRIATGLLTALSVGIMVAGPGARPALAATCKGYTCHGRDPVIYSCAISSSQSGSDDLVTLWLRQSVGCNSYWARAQLSAKAIADHYTMEVAVDSTDVKGQEEYMCYPGPGNTGDLREYCTGNYGGPLPAYTDMVDGSYTVALAIVYVFTPSGHIYEEDSI